MRVNFITRLTELGNKNYKVNEDIKEILTARSTKETEFLNLIGGTPIAGVQSVVHALTKNNVERRAMFEQKATAVLASVGVLCTIISAIAAAFSFQNFNSGFAKYFFLVAFFVPVVSWIASLFFATRTIEPSPYNMLDTSDLNALLTSQSAQLDAKLTAQEFVDAMINEKRLTLKANFLDSSMYFFQYGIWLLVIFIASVGVLAVLHLVDFSIR